MWSIDLVRRQAARSLPTDRVGDPTAIVLTRPREAGEEVAACCELATRAGVHPGMRLADARPLLAGRLALQLGTEDEARDRGALHALATWALRFSPIVAEEPPTGLLLDAFGLSRLFGSETTWMQQVAEGIAKLDIHVRAAIADTIGCAWAIANHGAGAGPAPQTIVPSGSERDALAPLPIEALRVDARTAATLFEVGVERIEHLLRLPRQDLSRRFGDDLLLRLDQALGSAYEVVRPNRVVQPVRAETVFHGPVKNLEAVLRIVDQLSTSLCEALDERQVGAREVVLELARFDASPIGHRLALTRPTSDAAHIAHLLRGKVERTHLGGGIELMALTASKVSALEHLQRSALLTSDAPGASAFDGAQLVADGESDRTGRRLGALFDVLIERCGRDRVVGVEPVASYIPEHAFRSVPLSDRSPEDCPIVEADRPSVLYDRPEPAEAIALLPDGPPSWIRWRREEARIVSALGPERIGAPWWNGRSRTTRCLAYRDYFKVQDERGRWLWVFRGTETGHWFVHGEWA